MIGCFRVTDGYVCDDLGWTINRVSKAFVETSNSGFLTRDERLNWVLIHKFMLWNPIESGKQGIHAVRLLEQVPDGALAPIKTLTLKALRQFGGRHIPPAPDRVSIGYPKGIDTRSRSRLEEPSQEENVYPASATGGGVRPERRTLAIGGGRP
jgi:hypothetical protein